MIESILGSVHRGTVRTLYRRASLGPNVSRIAMYEDLGKSLAGWLQRNRHSANRVISISESQNLCKFLGLDAINRTEASYPEYDLLDLAFPEDSFDVLIADQVLEHVAGDPFRALEESCRVVRPGGLVIHTTCFYNAIHEHPGDYWRFTPAALELMLRKHGKLIALGGWGSRWMPLIELLHLRYLPVPLANSHPLYRIAHTQDTTRPITTWAAIEVSSSMAEKV